MRARFNPQLAATFALVGLVYPFYEGIVWNGNYGIQDWLAATFGAKALGGIGGVSLALQAIGTLGGVAVATFGSVMVCIWHPETRCGPAA